MEPSGLQRFFQLPAKKGTFHSLIRRFLIVIPFVVQNSLVLREGSFEVVANFKFVRTQSISFVVFLIVDLHRNNGKP